MIANERRQHYDALKSTTAKDIADFANDMELDQDYDVLPNIVADNAALKVKLKQECDIAHVIKKNISKADAHIGSLKRDINHYDQLIDIKTKELAKLEEELTNLSISREHVRSNTENLKRQYELITIEDEQRKKEQDSVRSNYERMIRNRKEIFNSNRLVVRRNHLRNHCEGARIQSAVLEERLKELHRQKTQFREIQNLNLKSASVELAQDWLNNKKENDSIVSFKNQLCEKRNVYDRILSQKSKPSENDTRSPGSRFVSLPMPNFSQPLQIPPLNAEETELTKYFRKINVFKKSRSAGLLPNVLARSIALKEKESDSPTKANVSRQSPAKKNVVKDPNENFNEKEKQTPESPKLTLEEATKTSAFQPVNAASNASREIVEIKLRDTDSPATTEKSRQTPTFTLDNHSPNSPGKVTSCKFKPVEKYVSPLTVSRMSPMNTPSNKSPMRSSRIPVPLSTSSPIHSSRIPVRRTPVSVNQKRDYVEKETISRRTDTVKKVDGSSPIDIQINTTDVNNKNQAFKRSDVGSPRRGVKYPKMDYAYMNANRTLSRGMPDSGEIPTIEVDQNVSPMKRHYHRNELNVESLIDEVNNENNPMIKSYHERMKMLREEYSAKGTWNDDDEIEKLKKSAKDSKKPENIAREPFKIDNRHLNKNARVSRGAYDTNEIPTIEVDQIEEDVDENPPIKSSVDQLRMIREGYVRKDTWKDRHEPDDNEILRKSAKDSKRTEFVARETYKLDTRRFIKDQIDVSNKHYDKFQANLYRPQPKDFRDIEKIDPRMTSKDSVSRFEKMEESIKKLPDEADRVPNKYKDVAYSKSSEIFLESSENLSRSSSSSVSNGNRSEAFFPFGGFISPSASNKYTPPFGVLGERGGSMFSYDTGVNQLFGPSTDGANSQSQNQNNGFFGFNFTSSSDQNDQPLKIF